MGDQGSHGCCGVFRHATCQKSKGAAAPWTGRCPKLVGCLLSSRLFVSGKCACREVFQCMRIIHSSALKSGAPLLMSSDGPAVTRLEGPWGCINLDPAFGGTDAQAFDGFCQRDIDLNLEPGRRLDHKGDPSRT